ncbi:MAG: ATP-binding protein [Desulfovibrionales bacterium]
MREIIILSGKGGTGKTSITGAFAQLAENKILCDLDVDAPDLHILLQPEHEVTEEFFSGHEARIDQDRCVACGLCEQVCRFDAVVVEDEQTYRIDPLRCEGCKVCVQLCPSGAIDFPDRHCGQWYISNTRFGPMVHAQLFPGEENSGLLVSLLKRKAKALAREKGTELILCDGAPGIGCPVIASLSGADLVVLITEPTPSGKHDVERVADLCSHFNIPLAGIINKADINQTEANEIASLFRRKQFPLIARLPHDSVVTKAMVQRKVVTEVESEMTPILEDAWNKILELAYQPA